MKMVQQACGDFPGLMAPSFMLPGGIDISLLLDKLGGKMPTSMINSMLEFVNSTNTAEKLFNQGFDKNNLTRELSFHKSELAVFGGLLNADFSKQEWIL